MTKPKTDRTPTPAALRKMARQKRKHSSVYWIAGSKTAWASLGGADFIQIGVGSRETCLQMLLAALSALPDKKGTR